MKTEIFGEKGAADWLSFLPGQIENATGDWTRSIRLIRANPCGLDTRVRFHANMLDQKILCYLDHSPSPPVIEAG